MCSRLLSPFSPRLSLSLSLSCVFSRPPFFAFLRVFSSVTRIARRFSCSRAREFAWAYSRRASPWVSRLCIYIHIALPLEFLVLVISSFFFAQHSRRKVYCPMGFLALPRGGNETKSVTERARASVLGWTWNSISCEDLRGDGCSLPLCIIT